MIRFKGSSEMANSDRNNIKDMEIQTEKSYLLRKSRKKVNKENPLKVAYQQEQYPFMKPGWWL